MLPPKGILPHGGVRGANLSRSSLNFGGPFGRIFRAVPPADFGADDQATLDNLAKLAMAMTSVADPQDPKDGPDSEEGGIPAAYTYFGQFIDHDLTFDPASSLQKQDDPDALQDFRTRKLGPVGGRIVAETFVGLLFADSSSYLSLNPLWEPTALITNGVFGLRELIKTALS